ncbi:MAG: peptidoglycan recognition family protein [Candidatus Bathyarchaeia archaeon]
MGKVVNIKEFLNIVKNLKKSGRIRRFFNYVVLHHTSSPSYKDWQQHPEPSYWFNAINEAHKQRGWKCIGYHVLIMPNGAIVLGRHPNETGAHVKGHNSYTVGVACLGNFNKGCDVMKWQQLRAMQHVVTALIYLCQGAPSTSCLLFHRDLASTDCPGTAMDITYIRRHLIAPLIGEIGRLLA